MSIGNGNALTSSEIGYYHNVVLSYIHANQDSSWLSMSIPARRTAVMDLMDDAGANIMNYSGSYLAEWDAGANEMADSLEAWDTLTATRITNLAVDCANLGIINSTEKSYITQAVNLIETATTISQLESDLDDLKSDFDNEIWGTGEGIVAGATIYVAVNSLDYWKNDTYHPTRNDVCGILAVDAIGAAAGALREGIKQYESGGRVSDWGKVGREAATGAIVSSTMGVLGGWIAKLGF